MFTKKSESFGNVWNVWNVWDTETTYRLKAISVENKIKHCHHTLFLCNTTEELTQPLQQYLKLTWNVISANRIRLFGCWTIQSHSHIPSSIPCIGFDFTSSWLVLWTNQLTAQQRHLQTQQVCSALASQELNQQVMYL